MYKEAMNITDIEMKLVNLDRDFDNKRIDFEEYIRQRSILISKKEKFSKQTKNIKRCRR